MILRCPVGNPDPLEDGLVINRESRSNTESVLPPLRSFHLVAKLEQSIHDGLCVLAVTRKAHVVGFNLPKMKEQRVPIDVRNQQLVYAFNVTIVFVLGLRDVRDANRIPFG